MSDERSRKLLKSNVISSWEKPQHTKKIVARFFWYGIYNKIADCIQKCDQCQRRKSFPTNVKNEMHSVPVSPYIIKQVHLDLCSLPKVNGYRHIMVCNGFFTKWLQTKPVRDNAAFTVTTFLHSHKKRKDRQETRDVLLTFSLKRNISGVAVQGIHENRGGMAAFSEDFLNKDGFEVDSVIFYSYGYEKMVIMPTFLRQFRTSLQVKNIITNALCVL